MIIKSGNAKLVIWIKVFFHTLVEDGVWHFVFFIVGAVDSKQEHPDLCQLWSNATVELQPFNASIARPSSHNSFVTSHICLPMDVDFPDNDCPQIRSPLSKILVIIEHWSILNEQFRHISMIHNSIKQRQ